MNVPKIAVAAALMVGPLPVLTQAAHAQAIDNALATSTSAHQSGDTEGAAEVPEGVIAEVMVTAEKRSTSLQRTPVSVTALSGEDLAKAQVRSLTDMNGLVPNFQMSETEGYAQITIRGIGITNFTPLADGAVAVNLNEVYVSRPIAQLAGMYDVSSIEVLRGPQGTLYGRNATAGSVNMATTRPTSEWSGNATLTGGNYGLLRAEGAVGGPIAGDTLLVRVAAFQEKRDGYGKNIVTGNDIDDKDAYGVRGTLVFKPVPEVTATLIGEYYKERSNGASLHYFGPAGLLNLPGTLGIPPVSILLGGTTASDPQDIANGADPKFRLRTSALTGILEWESDHFSVKSVSGYRDQDSYTFTPLDGASVYHSFYEAGEPAHQFSQELQAHYETDRLHLTAGLYYFDEKDSALPSTGVFSNTLLFLSGAFPFLPPPSSNVLINFAQVGGTLRTKAKAAFAQGTYEVAPGLSVTAGIRFSRERKSFVQRNAFDFFTPYTPGIPAPPSVAFPPRTFKATTPRFGVQYQVSPQTFLYATYAKGFKSGSFDPGVPGAPSFEPETLNDYEGGIKTTLLDNRLRANLSSFYYDYSNLQVLQIVGINLTTTNAASARVYGVEGEFTALPTDNLTIDLSMAYTHARYQTYMGADAARPLLLGSADFSGNTLNNAPDFRAHLGGEYRLPLADGELSIRADGDYSSEAFFSAANLPLIGQKAFFKANASLRYTSAKHWSVTGFVRNITNKTTRVSAVVNTPLVGNPVQGSYAPPRTFGLELGYEF